jgi:transposase-like protein
MIIADFLFGTFFFTHWGSPCLSFLALEVSLDFTPLVVRLILKRYRDNQANRRSFVMAGKKGMKHYPRWMKRKAIELYTQGGWSAAKIIAHFGIRDPNRICSWMSQYRKEGEAMFEKKPRGRPPKKENTAAYIARLEMELDLLKKFHTELRQSLLAKRNIGQSTTTEENTK